MKKTYLSAALVTVLGLSLLTSSCIGSFGMTNRVLTWNKQIGSKFVNELVFFAFWILPVYEVTGLADLLVLNSIEFWSGSNPMATGTKVIEGQDGRYLVDCDGKGYTIKSEIDGSEVRLDFDADCQTWSVELPDGQNYELMTFVDDSHVLMPADSDGHRMLVDLSEQGLMAYRTHAASAVMMAAAR